MKITLVCGHFLPAMGYIEVHMARAFAEMGHRVTVVTSGAVPKYVRHLHEAFGLPPRGVEVIRLRPLFTLGQIVVARGVKQAVKNSDPKLIIIIGPGKRFPKPVFSLDTPTVTLLGDNAKSYSDGSSFTRFRNKMLFEIFKRSTYEQAVDKSSTPVAYTPESFEAAAKVLGGRRAETLGKQWRFIDLGYWPEEFYYDSYSGKEKRRELGYSPDDKVIITATRLRPEKNLEEVIKIFSCLPPNFKWLLVGSGRDAFAMELENKLKAALPADRFRVLPHCRREELNALYNSADAALYTVPAISITEALGTGLPLILPEMKSLDRITGEGFRSVVLDENPDEVAAGIAEMDFSSKQRLERSKRAIETFSWPVQVRRLLTYIGH